MKSRAKSSFRLDRLEAAMTRMSSAIEQMAKEIAGVRKEQAEMRKEQIEIRKEQAEMRKEQMEIRKEQTEIRKEMMEMRKEQTEIRKEQMEMRKEQTEIRKEQMEMRKDLRDAVSLMQLTVGGFQRRAGRKLEDALAGAIRWGLGLEIKPENIQIRKKIQVGDQTREVDMFLYNRQTYIVEVSSYADQDKIQAILDRAALVERYLGKKVQKVLITLDRSDEVIDLCEQHHIVLIP